MYYVYIICSIEKPNQIKEKDKEIEFEKYLKSGAGRAFIDKRLL